MKGTSLFSLVMMGLIGISVAITIEWANEKGNPIIDQKELYTKANEMSRKPYVIQRYDDMICAERVERTARQMAYIEEYCKGGMFMGLWPPDSLKKEVHYEMEVVVDSLARLEGYGGW